MRLLSAVIAAALLGPALPRAAQPVRIGVIDSLSGPEAPIGENLAGGYRLAAEDLRARGIPVELIWEDDGSKPQDAIRAFEKLATRDGVAGVVGPYTSASSAAVAKRAEQYRVPLLIPAAAKEDLTRQGLRWVFRLSATTDDYAAILLDLALHHGKPRTIAIVNESTDFGVSAARSARALAERRGLEVVSEESYRKGSLDHRRMLARVKSARPDLVFLVSYVADALQLMRQARELGLAPQAFLGAGAGFATVQFASDRAVSENVFSSTQWTGDARWPGARTFFARYEARFGKEPTYHAACAYASLLALGESAARAGGDRETTRAELRRGTWQGIMGQVRFGDFDGYTNQNRHPMLVEQVQNGRQVTVYPPDLATHRPVYPFPGWK